MLIAGFAYSLPSTAASTSKPYKAETVDECIQEKECVWWIFKKLFLQDAQHATKDDVLMRWERPVDIRVMDGDKYLNELHSVIADLQPQFPHKIYINGNGANVFFLFGENIEKAYLKHHRFFESILRNRMVFIDAMLSPNISTSNCGSVYLNNSKKEIIGGLLLSTISSKTRVNCINFNAYKILTANGIWALPSALDENFKDPEAHMTKLDHFILRLFNSPLLTTGMPLAEIEGRFNNVYVHELNNFYESSGENSK
ncbi:MAG: hypothetical protein HYS17_03775 [Micavibrio aeruginosavorus]|uniref:Uncharacterized protein n=1 Tax=Micavibrio aeruginosavorus TaxID=349221 RepID=A0A7T5UHF2_9BACT|nr:MAG: hypothetical protein HYS17_03775 [Micavibrio aeruginosavorus]